MSKSAKSPRASPILRALARIQNNAAFGEDKDAEPESPPDVEDGANESDDESIPSPEGDDSDPEDPRDDEGPTMDPEEADPEDIDEDEEEFTLDDVLKCFLRANPTPSDEQVHAFSELMGLTPEDFEAEVFRKFGEVVRQATSLGPSEIEEPEDVEGGDGEDTTELDVDEADQDDDGQELQADEELGVQDDIDMFVVSYILFNPQPSDEQIHSLAFVVNLTKDEMEQRIYRMLGTFLKMRDEDPELDQGTEDDTSDESEPGSELDSEEDNDQSGSEDSDSNDSESKGK